jgi:hypothetical protein
MGHVWCQTLMKKRAETVTEVRKAALRLAPGVPDGAGPVSATVTEG